MKKETQSLVDMIENNVNEFCEVSDKDEVKALLDVIGDNCSEITNTFLKDSINSLQKNIKTTTTKIDSIKVENTDK